MSRCVCFGLVLLYLTQVQGGKMFTINKCCPEGQAFNRSKLCEPWEEHPSDMSWFPVELIVNSSTLHTHTHHQAKYQDILNTTYQVKYDSMPTCQRNTPRVTGYYKKGYFNHFHFLMDKSGKMEVYFALPGTFSKDEMEDFEFPEINSDKNATITDSPKGALRRFPLRDMCLDLVPEVNAYVMELCPCNSVICIRKCCEKGSFMNESQVHLDTGGCQSMEETNLTIPEWRPQSEGMTNNYYLLTDTFPSCQTPQLLKSFEKPFRYCTRMNSANDNNFVVHSNGTIRVNKYKNMLFLTHQYCGEVVWHPNGEISEQNLILCSAGRKGKENANQTTTESDGKPTKFFVYGALLVTGGVCLLLTVLVSVYLPELRRRVHNKIALSHNFSLMIAYFAWGTLQLAPSIGDISCIVTGFLIQFTFLGSFFWLNVMCFDISMTFSATKKLGGGGLMSGENRTFLYYNLYAWGCTSLISIFTIAMEFAPNVPSDVFRPGFTCTCGFNKDNGAILIYFYGPMLILLAVNLVLFIFTTVKIMAIQRQTTSILHKTDSNATGGSSYQTEKQRYDSVLWLILYSKLFLLMGLTWITEIISWAVGGADYLWYITDGINLLRGVFIFIIFICKKSVLKSLSKKLAGESFSLSNKTVSSKSTTDVMSITTSRDSRCRSSTSSSKRKESKGQQNMEIEMHRGQVPQVVYSTQVSDNLDESCI